MFAVLLIYAILIILEPSQILHVVQIESEHVNPVTWGLFVVPTLVAGIAHLLLLRGTTKLFPYADTFLAMAPVAMLAGRARIDTVPE